jgi:DNA-binding Lrp family transcriptional regulator
MHTDEQMLLATVAEISDRLIPQLRLDTYEQALYWYLFRQTHLLHASETTISYAAIEKAIGVTKTAATRRLRSLEEKGCIKVVDTGWGGTKVSVSLPEQVLGPVAALSEAQPVDVEAINFFSQAQYREAILHREGSLCFYCLKRLSSENYALDHLVPQIDGGNDSYRNVVAACHSCNSSKNARSAEDFLRGLLRSGRLGDAEFEQRLLAVAAVKQGELKPDV